MMRPIKIATAATAPATLTVASLLADQTGSVQVTAAVVTPPLGPPASFNYVFEYQLVGAAEWTVLNTGTTQNPDYNTGSTTAIRSITLPGLGTYNFRVKTVDPTQNYANSPYTYGNQSSTVVANTITVIQTLNGSITPTSTSGVISVAPGGSRTFNIVANAGSTITDVLVDNVSVGIVTSYTFTNITANHTIRAVFNGPVTSSNVRNITTQPTTYYPTLQDAYNAAANNEVIELKSTINSGVFLANRTGINVTINGGFDNTFTTVTGVSTIRGKLTLQQGSVRMKNVKVRP